jgi:hypothetical protein
MLGLERRYRGLRVRAIRAVGAKDNAQTLSRRSEIPVLYASLKAIHLLAVIAWVGGMFFMLMCLRPAVHEVLEAPPRCG